MQNPAKTSGFLVLILLAFSCMVEQVSSTCCTYEVKCGNDCCGKGPCNLFCCNCEGGCRLTVSERLRLWKPVPKCQLIQLIHCRISLREKTEMPHAQTISPAKTRKFITTKGKTTAKSKPIPTICGKHISTRQQGFAEVLMEPWKSFNPSLLPSTRTGMGC